MKVIFTYGLEYSVFVSRMSPSGLLTTEAKTQTRAYTARTTLKHSMVLPLPERAIAEGKTSRLVDTFVPVLQVPVVVCCYSIYV